MSKKIKLTEVTHQWSAKAITRNTQGQLEEIELGVRQSQLKLKETGAKELFKDALPPSTIAVEVSKNADVTIVYEMDAEEFKKNAKVVEEPKEEQPQQ